MIPIVPTYPHFTAAINAVQQHLKQWGVHLETESWQGRKKPTEFFEALNVSFSAYIANDIEKLKLEIKPNLPWADNHFAERIGGQPLNPGEQYKQWPYYKNNPKNDVFRDRTGQFSHTYMERFWPKTAGYNRGKKDRNEHSGIHFEVGDYGDVCKMIQKEPFTRQAYLPIWFPEDSTAALEGARVPCTLGYHFIRRGDTLNITYYIRSCDFIRHFRDDIYMACKLVFDMLSHLRQNDINKWVQVMPGRFTMHITSLHIFSPEYNLL